MEAQKNRLPIIVKNPYTQKEVDVEPLLKLLSKHSQHYPEMLCNGFRKIQLEVMANSCPEWHEELTLLNDAITMIVESQRGVHLAE